MKTKTEFKTGWYLQFKRSLALRAGVLLLFLPAISSPAQSYMILHYFTSLNDGWPRAGLVLSNGVLYGTCFCNPHLSVTNHGTVFRVNTNGSDYGVLKYFPGPDGMVLAGGLVLSGTTLYGTALSGGTNNSGTVFKINTDGSVFSVLKNFTRTDGANPWAGLVLSDATLYGTTALGGANDDGTVFKVNTDGSDFTVLKEFYGSDGANPYGSLVLSGTTLYGTAADGGTNYNGEVFKINTDGSDFTVLKRFTGDDGSYPFAGLVLTGATLYGTTVLGGTNDKGTVFKVNTDGSGFTVLKEFDGSDGANPYGSLVLSGTTLYGTTESGGTNNWGTVFEVNTDGSRFAVLKTFTENDGGYSRACLTLSGTMLYGTASGGGISNAGVIFSLSIAPPTISAPLQSQTAEPGSTINFGMRITGSVPQFCQWFFNGCAIAGCENRILCLSGVQATNVGAYSVVISNIFGAVTSSPAMLNVIPAVERRPVPGVNVMGDAGSLLSVDYASSLDSAANWTALGSVSLTSTSQFCPNLTAPLPAQRFYRAWQTGVPGVVPSLKLNFVPAITLTGNIGDTLRVDCINAIGPTDAWLTLDTVTMTNTSQLYFDVTAPGQPRRLYRIMPVHRPRLLDCGDNPCWNFTNPVS